MIEAAWHDDGHVIHLELVRTAVEITSVSCPQTGDCKTDETSCVVRRFLEIYGLECNVGVTDAAPDITIAWSLIGNKADLDACQLWVIPTDDVMFQAWTSPS